MLLLNEEHFWIILHQIKAKKKNTRTHQLQTKQCAEGNKCNKQSRVATQSLENANNPIGFHFVSLLFVVKYNTNSF